MFNNASTSIWLLCVGDMWTPRPTILKAEILYLFKGWPSYINFQFITFINLTFRFMVRCETMPSEGAQSLSADKPSG